MEQALLASLVNKFFLIKLKINSELLQVLRNNTTTDFIPNQQSSYMPSAKQMEPQGKGEDIDFRL